MSKIILISGQQGSGKSTLADNLWDHFSDHGKAMENVAKIKFADPLYAAHEGVKDAMEGFGVKMAEKDGLLLQLLGTDWGRKKSPDIWVKIALKRIAELERVNPNYVILIDDCRFPNEFVAFPHALRIRLKADEAIRKTRTKSWRENTGHESETALDGLEDQFELVIDTGTNLKTDTFKKVMEIFEMKFSESLED